MDNRKQKVAIPHISREEMSERVMSALKHCRGAPVDYLPFLIEMVVKPCVRDHMGSGNYFDSVKTDISTQYPLIKINFSESSDGGHSLENAKRLLMYRKVFTYMLSALGVDKPKIDDAIAFDYRSMDVRVNALQQQLRMQANQAWQPQECISEQAQYPIERDLKPVAPFIEDHPGAYRNMVSKRHGRNKYERCAEEEAIEGKTAVTTKKPAKFAERLFVPSKEELGRAN